MISTSTTGKQLTISMFVMLCMGLFLFSADKVHAQDTLVVEWLDPDTGGVWVNSLRNTILGDTTATGERANPDRVYKLKRGGFYWNQDRIENDGFHLQIVGEPGDPTDEFGNPPVLQMVTREDGSVDQRMITGMDDVTLKNLWITGRDDLGAETAYQPIQIDAANSTIVIKNNIIEHTNFAMIAFTASGNKIHYHDNIFRNLVGTDQVWEGRGISIWDDQEEVIIENNTFFNFGMTVLQIEGGAADYVRFNHNTIVTVGRAINAGNWWRDAFFANNLIVNAWWHGESPAEYDTDPPRDASTAGIFSIGTLPSRYGVDATRRIVFTNTGTWRDPAFNEYYADSIRSQPLFNETTLEWFEDFDGMVAGPHIEDENPNFAVYPDNIDDLIQNIIDLRNDEVPAHAYYWDPGRGEDPTEINWPLPEDFSYTNETLLTASTGGLPLGDLNWFPDKKQEFLDNYDSYIQDIENLAGDPIVLSLVNDLHAEEGDIDGDATQEMFDGFAFFSMDGAGHIEYTFDVPAAGEHSLHIRTHMRDNNERGQHILLNGTGLRNDDEAGDFMFRNVPTNDWYVHNITAGDLIEETQDALTLEEGENTLRIEPSWGWQRFADIEVRNAGGDVIAELNPVYADADGVDPVCQGADYCANNFRWAALGYDGGEGSVSWDQQFPADGEYFVRIFYHTESGGSGDLVVDGDVVSTLDFDDGDNFVDSGTFNLDGGAKNIGISASGGVDVDYMQLYFFGTITSSRKLDIPEGFALEQNYPNPFNPTTSINFSIPHAADVNLEVYNLLGQRVAILANGFHNSGSHTINFDASHLASGMYIYRIRAGEFVQTRKMMLIK